MLKAVIFDMDGVIIDSEPQHARAAILALKEYKVELTLEYLQSFIGSTTYHMCRKMIDDYRLSATPEELLQSNIEWKQKLLKQEGHTVVPYIIDLMKDLHQNHIKLIIASSSPPDAISEVMNSLNISEYFEGFVSGISVPHPKPAPDIFLEAAKLLGVLPSECLVIEDSFHGVTAAKSAGMTCIGFVNLNSGNQDLSLATMLVEGFDEIDYAFLNKVYHYHHMEPINIITTEHFLIKELQTGDIDELYRICRDEQILPYLDDFEDNLELEKEKLTAYIQNVYHFYGFGLWGVFFKETGKLVGRCGIELKAYNLEEIYEIGYLLEPAYQGNGYANEFVSAVIRYGFDQLGINRINAIIDKNNKHSIHLALKVGMQKVGECTQNNRDCYLFEINAYGISGK